MNGEIKLSTNEFFKQINLTDNELLEALFARALRHNFTGLDPSIVRFNPHFLRFVINAKYNNFFAKISRGIVYNTLFYLGHHTHSFLHPEKRQLTKGIALYYSALANICHSGKTLNLQFNLIKTNLENCLQQKKLSGKNLWAHDYNYQIQNTIVTTTTPNLVTTAFVANAYWEWWRHTGIKQYGDIFCDIVSDMLEAFPFIKSKQSGCFMYTPNSSYFVHNANLLMAELLSKKFLFDADEKALELLFPSIRYSLDDYAVTNSIPYAGPPTPNRTFDNYHTGYILRSLEEIRKNIPELDKQFDISYYIKFGLKFYLEKFINNGLLQRDTNRMILETHSLAEGILISKVFNNWLTKEEKKMLAKSIAATTKKLWDSEQKYFINNIKRAPIVGYCIKDKSDMIRWSQAWMAFSIAFHNNNMENING